MDGSGMVDSASLVQPSIEDEAVIGDLIRALPLGSAKRSRS